MKKSELKQLIKEEIKSILAEDFPGPGAIVKSKDLDYDMLDYFSRTNKKLLITTKTKKNIKGSVGKMFNRLVFNGDDISIDDILSVKIVESSKIDKMKKSEFKQLIKEELQSSLEEKRLFRKKERPGLAGDPEVYFKKYGTGRELDKKINEIVKILKPAMEDYIELTISHYFELARFEDTSEYAKSMAEHINECKRILHQIMNTNI